MPFQGLNNLYLQLLTGLHGPPKYSEIRVKRANHGWGITGGDVLRDLLGRNWRGRRESVAPQRQKTLAPRTKPPTAVRLVGGYPSCAFPACSRTPVAPRESKTDLARTVSPMSAPGFGIFFSHAPRPVLGMARRTKVRPLFHELPYLLRNAP